MPNAAYVTAGKPKYTGAIYRAAKGTTPIPTDASTAIDTTVFKELGYVSDDGVTNSYSVSTDVIKAWGNDPVLLTRTDISDTWSFTLIEPLNLEVQKAVYGSGNVTGALATGVTVSIGADEAEEGVWVIDMVMNSSTAKRVVIPHGTITELGDVTYTDADAVGYEVTVTATPDSSGQYQYEYYLQS